MNENPKVFDSFFSSFIFPYVFPVLGLTKRDGFEFLGSGFLLKYKNRFLFISAAHVLDNLYEKQLYIPCHDTGLIKLNDPFFTSATLEPRARRDDKLDFGCIFLDQSKKTQLEETSYLTLDFLDERKEVDSTKSHFIAGYPINRNKNSVDVSSKLIKSSVYGSICHEITNVDYKKVGVSTTSSLILYFDRKKNVNMNGLKVTSPMLNGLSGSPVWGVNKDDQLLVSGILIEYHQGSSKFILVTRVYMVIELIRAILK